MLINSIECIFRLKNGTVLTVTLEAKTNLCKYLYDAEQFITMLLWLSNFATSMYSTITLLISKLFIFFLYSKCNN